MKPLVYATDSNNLSIAEELWEQIDSQGSELLPGYWQRLWDPWIVKGTAFKSVMSDFGLVLYTPF